MGGAALAVLFFTGGSVDLLVVLYSINVFITFSLSQLGMVRHWWQCRATEPRWRYKLLINGVGFILTASILVSLSVVKFHEGGWVTIVLTGALVAAAFHIRRRYEHDRAMLGRLDQLAKVTEMTQAGAVAQPPHVPPRDVKTAVILVNGFNGLGLHTLLGVARHFGGLFKNYVFLSVGVVDSGNFKGVDEIDHLKHHVRGELARYMHFMHSQGLHAECVADIGTDAVAKITELAPAILEKYPNSVFFGGQLVFPDDTLLTRLLHNQVVFAVQRRFYHMGFAFIILPIRV
jgi:K+ transporter